MTSMLSETRPKEPPVPPVNGCFLDRLVLIAASRGVVADRDQLAQAHGIAGDGFPLETVLAVADALDLRARHARLSWEDLGPQAATLPALLIFRDGATAILDALEPPAPETGPTRVLLRNEGPPDTMTESHLALDRKDLALFWCGDVILPGAR